MNPKGEAQSSFGGGIIVTMGTDLVDRAYFAHQKRILSVTWNM